MKRIVDGSNKEAKEHFLKGSSYFNGDFPSYISFETILKDVDKALNGESYKNHKAKNPDVYPGVNYNFVANKDGRLAWRPYELIHPVIYVSLVNLICDSDNWKLIQQRFSEYEKGAVTCCSAPVMSTGDQTDQATQVRSWWQRVEQQSLAYSLDFKTLLHTDVTNCYGSIYTHSISWALHGLAKAKASKGTSNLLGDKIDSHIRAGRYGQTNGISQGSVLMDFIAEIVLGYIDTQISNTLGKPSDFRILRYRDDYRIFAHSDTRAEFILKLISDKLREVGMSLGVSKTSMSRNVIEGSIKPDKIAGIELQDLGETNAQTIQKQLLRLHAFGLRFPNSGALRRLLGELHTKLSAQKYQPDDLDVQVAIATDIAVVSPLTFPAIAGILSHLISLSTQDQKKALWEKVHKKLKLVPYNGYLEIWMQRVTRPKSVNVPFSSDEAICKIVDGEKLDLWENAWISSKALQTALDVSKILVGSASDAKEVVEPKEVELFKLNAYTY